jgi:hypothetical protein
MYEDTAIWAQKGATLSDKSARQEFGLTQQEIFAAIRAGKLQFRESNMHGNPGFGCCVTKSRPWSTRKAAPTTFTRRSSKGNWPTSTRRPGS